MNSKKIYWSMLGLFSFSILVFFGLVVFGNSILKNSANSLLDLKLKNRLLNEQQAALTKAKRDIEKYQNFEQIAKAVVPQDKDQAKAVREIINIATKNGITVESIGFPSSELGGSSASTSTNQNPDAPKSKSSSDSQTKKSPITQAVPVKGVTGVYSLEMNIVQDTSEDSSSVTYPQLLNFLKSLENNRRTAQVTQLRIDPIAGTPYLKFSLTINIFVKPS